MGKKFRSKYSVHTCFPYFALCCICEVLKSLNTIAFTQSLDLKEIRSTSMNQFFWFCLDLVAFWWGLVLVNWKYCSASPSPLSFAECGRNFEVIITSLHCTCYLLFLLNILFQSTVLFTEQFCDFFLIYGSHPQWLRIYTIHIHFSLVHDNSFQVSLLVLISCKVAAIDCLISQLPSCP